MSTCTRKGRVCKADMVYESLSGPEGGLCVEVLAEEGPVAA